MAENIDIQNKEASVYQVMGFFFTIFGFLVVLAVFFTESFKGKITNLICSGLMFACGLIAFLGSRFVKRR